MPPIWQATAILHPFSPPPTSAPDPSPFFELCIANVVYAEGNAFFVQLLGASGRTWWYWVDVLNVTHLSTDEGVNWNTIETGWQFPSTQWLANGRYFASGPLNWMEGAPSVDWWTQPVAGSNAATWIWNDPVRGLPVRMMFGAPPPTYDTGTGDQLALFQNFSFTYFPTFAQIASFQPAWNMPDIPAFSFGDQGLELFVWNGNFGMSPMMTPVNAASNPLPTQVLYHWAADPDYRGLRGRAQRTTMSYVFNSQAPADPQIDTALMFGGAPAGMPNPPELAGHWFDYTLDNAGTMSCAMDPGGLVMGAEAPDWISTPGEEGQIWALVNNDPVVSPNNPAAICSVLFPPSDKYPQGRFLWTWYSPFPDGSNGRHARPVTFMESASSIAEGGTSLALADYYDYQEFADPIPPAMFNIPSICLPPAKHAPARKPGKAKVSGAG
ncbi:MAG TPA: hypothetical protein VLK25_06975 [Allosphingosinicella sp.]|nr:hypothetical protein [Allosphingosinicella sp.]